MNAKLDFPHADNWLEALPEPAILMDPVKDRILEVNERLRQLLEKSAHHPLETRRVTEMFSGQVPQLIVLTDEALACGQAWSRSLTVALKDATVIELELSLARVDNAHGTPSILMLLRDLQTLRERRERHENNT
jgi:hypothetical protein